MTAKPVALAALMLLAAMLPACAQTAPSPAPTYLDVKSPLEARVTDLFGRVTQDEKLSLLSGTGFTTQPIPRLGVPAMGMADAGQGVRGGTGGTQGPATLFGAEVNMAASWDTALLSRVGQAIGEEAKNKGEGAQVLLGPDLNIHRSPLGGRDSESFSEDPYLAGALAVAYIRGVQSTGTAACAKHFDANNEEQDRGTVNVEVSERALRGFYLPAFEAAVTQGHVNAVMAAYNKVNGPYCTANPFLLTQVLRRDWGFDGIVMSDWGAVHDTAGPVAAGCDLEMPGGDFMTPDKLSAALASGAITQTEIDEHVRRILRTIIRTGLLDGPRHPDPAMVNSPAHQQVALEVAQEGIVLLKNEGGVLPLSTARVHSIAVIGPAAEHLQAGSQGSPGLTPFIQSTPLDALRKRVGTGVAIYYSEGVSLPGQSPDPVPASALSPPPSWNETGPGLVGEYFDSPDLTGQPAIVQMDSEIDFGRGRPSPGDYGSARWQGTLSAPQTGAYTLAMMTRAGCRVLVDGKPVIDSPVPSGDYFHSGQVNLEAGRAYPFEVDLLGNKGPVRARLGWITPAREDIAGAASLARGADVALVFVTTAGTDGEGHDRPSMDLPGDQDRLIAAVAAANKNTVVILNAGSPVTVTGWLKDVPAVVDMGYPGEQAGVAIAGALFGDFDPCGKLPDTWGARREDYPDYGHFPGTSGVVDYTEGVYVGYRHFDKAGIAPVFPFGYGLSYTTFKYSGLGICGPLSPDGTVTATANVTDTGGRAGAEVAELYVRDVHPKEDRPVKELKGFARVELAPGETKKVTFTLSPRDLAYFDEARHAWRADAGKYDVLVGASSRDIRLTSRLRLTGDWTQPVP